MGDGCLSKFVAMLGNGVVLNVGSGQRSVKTTANWINLDVKPHANCEIVADAHWLPFRDASFDAVFSVSVFEHLRCPWQVAAEIARVLKPGGTMFCSVPFAYPLHASPHDFFRYTIEGLESIFSDLHTIEAAASTGPITTIALFAERVADALLPGKLGFIPRWIFAWSLQPFKYLDPSIVRRNPDAATSFAILMQKPAQ